MYLTIKFTSFMLPIILTECYELNVEPKICNLKLSITRDPQFMLIMKYHLLFHQLVNCVFVNQTHWTIID